MFKEKIKKLRTEQNLTQAEVAKAIGVSAATIGNYEQGTREPRNNEMWQKLANYFNVSVDELMDKNKETGYSDNSEKLKKKDWRKQYRTDTEIKYNNVDITPLVVDTGYDEDIPITRKQQYAYIEYTERSGHVLYARKKLLDILHKIHSQSKAEISHNLPNIIEYMEHSVIHWYKKCWNDIDDLFPTVDSLDSLYDLLNKCLCIDMIAQQEFTLIPIDEDFDWLREKLHP